MLWLPGALGFGGLLLAFVLSFVPPGQIATGSSTVWFSVLIIGCVIVVGIPFIIYAMRKPSWRDPQAAAEFAPFHWETPAAPATPAAKTGTPAAARAAGAPTPAAARAADKPKQSKQSKQPDKK